MTVEFLGQRLVCDSDITWSRDWLVTVAFPDQILVCGNCNILFSTVAVPGQETGF